LFRLSIASLDATALAARPTDNMTTVIAKERLKPKIVYDPA